MKVLFAIGNAQTSKSVADKYFQTYGEQLEYKDVFYFRALLEEVRRDSTYDRIIVSEELEPIKAVTIEEIDKVIFSNMDVLTDEAQNSTIAFIGTDRRTKTDALMARFYNLGVYSILLGNDRNISSLCDIIKAPRSKKEAREYLDMNPATNAPTSGSNLNDDEVDETQFNNILKHYEKLGEDTSKYVSSFESIEEQYNKKQLMIIVAGLCRHLPRVAEVISQDPRYAPMFDVVLGKMKPKGGAQKQVAKDNGKKGGLFNIFKSKSNEAQKIVEDSARLQAEEEMKAKNEAKKAAEEAQRIREESERIAREQAEQLRKAEEERKAKEEAEKQEALKQQAIEAQRRKEEERQQEALKQQAIEAQRRKEEEARQQEALKQQAIEAQRKKEEALKQQAIEEQKKREQNNLQNLQIDVVVEKPKDDAGTKLDLSQFASKITESKPQKDEIEIEVDLEGFKEKNNNVQNEQEILKQKMIEEQKAREAKEQEALKQQALEAQRRKEEEAKQQELLRQKALAEQKEKEAREQEALRQQALEAQRRKEEEARQQEALRQKALAEQKEREAKEQEALRQQALEAQRRKEEEARQQEALRQKALAEQKEREDAARLVAEEMAKQASTTSTVVPNMTIPTVGVALTTPGDDNDVVQNNFDTVTYQLPSDYKKVIAIVGTNKVGTTFIANAIANFASEKGIQTALLDMTKTKGLYYLYNKSDPKKIQIAAECIKGLSDGRNNPIPVDKNKRLNVYTTLPGLGENRKNFKHKTIIDTIKKTCNLLVIDCDFTTPLEYFEQASEIYIVQDMDLIKLQETTAFLREFKNRSIDWSKLNVIINKYVKSSFTPKKIVEVGLAFYNDPQMTYTEEFEVIKSYTTVPFTIEDYVRYTEDIVKDKIVYKNYSAQFKEAIEKICRKIYPSGDASGKKKGLFR